MTETHKLNDGPEHPVGPCCDKVTDLLGRSATLQERVDGRTASGLEGQVRENLRERISELEAQLAQEHETALKWHRDNMALAERNMNLSKRLAQEREARVMAEAGAAMALEAVKFYIWAADFAKGYPDGADYPKELREAKIRGYKAIASNSGADLLERVERLERELRERMARSFCQGGCSISTLNGPSSECEHRRARREMENRI